MSVVLNSNISSLKAQRRLGQSAYDLGKSFTRLSSGLRINKASDDAAGLSIASSLSVDSRVTTQGLRNLNDAVSAIAIAEGATEQLSTIAIRLKELAEQSANGTLSLVQRRSLQRESDKLVEEYNRICAVTEFNGLKLIDNSLQDVSVQAGYGDSGSIKFSLGNQLGQNVSNGTATGFVASTGGAAPADIAVTDLNNDGKVDLVATNFNAGAGTSVSVSFGNGDGTFQGPSLYTTTAGAYGIQIGDTNGDGTKDLVIAAATSGFAQILLGNSNGTFNASVGYALGGGAVAALEDFNNDGRLDIVGSSPLGDVATVLIGNGNGTFLAATFQSVGDRPVAVNAGDFNYDGHVDLVVLNETSDDMTILLGNGNGTFRSAGTYSAGNGPVRTALADVNRDGYLDIAVAASLDSQVRILLGNGNGSFSTALITGAGATTSSVSFADLNNDGYADLISTGSADHTYSYMQGNGDGTFRARISFVFAAGAATGIGADVNADGVADLLASAAGGSSVSVGTAGTKKSSTLPFFDILTQATALETLDMLTTALQRVAMEKGSIGSIQSRFGVATSVLQQMRENFDSAASQINDADIAEESSVLLRQQILQRASAAVLSQANQLPAIALQLLQSS